MALCLKIQNSPTIQNDNVALVGAQREYLVGQTIRILNRSFLVQMVVGLAANEVALNENTRQDMRLEIGEFVDTLL
jgi:hypothetical protein